MHIQAAIITERIFAFSDILSVIIEALSVLCYSRTDLWPFSAHSKNFSDKQYNRWRSNLNLTGNWIDWKCFVPSTVLNVQTSKRFRSKGAKSGDNKIHQYICFLDKPRIYAHTQQHKAKRWGSLRFTVRCVFIDYGRHWRLHQAAAHITGSR